ncbi:hypothetical protein D3C85_1742440 [compost metagenome]
MPVVRVVAEAERGVCAGVAVAEMFAHRHVHRAQVGPVDADAIDAVARGDFGGDDFLQDGVQAGVE